MIIFLLSIFIISAIINAYCLSAIREKNKWIDKQDEVITNLNEEIRLLRNKLLPTPLGYEDRYLQPKKRTEPKNKPVIPKVLTRSELKERRKDNPKFQNQPQPDYPRINKSIEQKQKNVLAKAGDIINAESN